MEGLFNPLSVFWEQWPCFSFSSWIWSKQVYNTDTLLIISRQVIAIGIKSINCSSFTCFICFDNRSKFEDVPCCNTKDVNQCDLEITGSSYRNSLIALQV